MKKILKKTKIADFFVKFYVPIMDVDFFACLIYAMIWFDLFFDATFIAALWLPSLLVLRQKLSNILEKSWLCHYRKKHTKQDVYFPGGK